MGKTRKIVATGLAVGLALALVAYVLVPRNGPSPETIIVNQPPPPDDTGSTPTGDTPRVRPDKAHGENSNGPKHLVCLPLNEHVQGVAQYQGANWYRGTCPAGAAPMPEHPAQAVADFVTGLAAAFGWVR